MIFSGTVPPKDDSFTLMVAQLRGIGLQEIKLWKELVLADHSLFPKIYHVIYSGNEKAAWRAACIIDHVSEENSVLLEPYITELIKHLPKSKNGSVKRHLTRMLLRYPIPEDHLGEIVETSYELLSRTEPIAVRANALLLLYNISCKIPDLQPELKCVVENMLESGEDAAIISRGKKIIKSLSISGASRRSQRT